MRGCADAERGAACTGGFECISGSCVPLTCTPSCASGETCDAGTCRCGSNPACAGTEMCVSGSCVEPPMCLESPCGLWPNCGCSGGACDTSEADRNARICRVAGSGGHGDPCTEQFDCAAGTTCARGQCHQYCDTTADCPGPEGSRCALTYLTSGGTPIPGTTFCTIGCNPGTANGCLSGDSCEIYVNGEGTVTDCRAAMFEVFPFCMGNESCDVNRVCVGLLAPCKDHCRVGVAADCPSGTCDPLADSPVWGGYTWGACTPPAS